MADDPRVNDAISDLSAYALSLDAERDRLDDRFTELVAQESSTDERRAVARERGEIEEERSAFRRIIGALARGPRPPAGTPPRAGDDG